MGNLWDRVGEQVGTLALRSRGIPLAEILGRLESSPEPARVARDLDFDAADLIAVLAHAALGEHETDGPALVQTEPRWPGLAAALDEATWRDLAPRSQRPARLALAAGLLQIHDFWDASHTAAQQADDLGERSVSAYWHGIAHRREPDPGNASYWFRRVGRHPVFEPLAAAARPLLDAHGSPTLTAQLLPRGAWDPFGFIELCRSARAGTELAALATALQRLEMIALLDPTAEAVLG
jgi:hypothetical protein